MRVRALVLVVSFSAAALAAPEQLTNSAGDSTVQRIGPPSTRLIGIVSNGNLTPGLPGNTDATNEVFRLNLADKSLLQLTNSAANSSATRITAHGLFVISSNGDLTPGAPGNADGSFENWLYRPTSRTTGTLTQMTSSTGDTFFQTFWDDGDRAFFGGRGDLTPGAPGNLDGSQEVWSYDVGTNTLTQLTNTTHDTLIRGICNPAHCAVMESSGDLVPGQNADGSTEIFLFDLDTPGFEQITHAATGASHYRGQDATGRFLALESTADLTPGSPGNADASQEVYVYDRTAKTLTQLTNSAGTSSFSGFVPRTRLVLVGSREDLAPAAGALPGNADKSRELFTVDIGARRVVQQTASSADSFFAGFASSKSPLAAIESGGNIDGKPLQQAGTSQVFLKKIGAKPGKAKRLTDDPSRSSSVGGFDAKGRFIAIESPADLVPASRGRLGNADHSVEVFVARTAGRSRLKQVTASAADSEFADFVDARRVLVNSRGDLAPNAPGNTDGSREVFRVSFR
jgi:Tol biopolymer transport system component